LILESFSILTRLVTLTTAPTFKALLAQFAGLAVAFAVGRCGVLPAGIWPLVAVQAAAATGTAIALKSAPWWRWIHLGFTPLVAGALLLQIAPGENHPG